MTYHQQYIEREKDVTKVTRTHSALVKALASIDPEDRKAILREIQENSPE